ncbi:hypothetical protein GGR55DRAFT_694253 [Xylaria sp. FL0064]|nr:hypothetical protein GGR55DRAFT_694253 [Xylaria sp. FL0064]
MSYTSLPSEIIETEGNDCSEIKDEQESKNISEEKRCHQAQSSISAEPAIGLESANEGPVIVKLFEDWIFLPQSLPEFIDMIFDFFNIPSVEALELPGKVRVKWKCQCGTQLYDDFSGSATDSHGLLQLQLTSTKVRGLAFQIIQRNIRVWIGEKFAKARDMRQGWASSSSGGQHNTGLPLSSLPVPTCSHQTLQAGSTDLHLMLCIGEGQELPTLCQESVLNVSSDEELFQFLRTQYWKLRKLPSWFTLRCVKRLSLTQVSPAPP